MWSAGSPASVGEIGADAPGTTLPIISVPTDEGVPAMPVKCETRAAEAADIDVMVMPPWTAWTGRRPARLVVLLASSRTYWLSEYARSSKNASAARHQSTRLLIVRSER